MLSMHHWLRSTRRHLKLQLVIFFVLDADDTHKTFQLLAYRQRMILAKTFRAQKAMACHISVQWMETWSASEIEGQMHLDVFEVEDPTSMDLADFVNGMDARSRVFRWTEVRRPHPTSSARSQLPAEYSDRACIVPC